LLHQMRLLPIDPPNAMAAPMVMVMPFVVAHFVGVMIVDRCNPESGRTLEMAHQVVSLGNIRAGNCLLHVQQPPNSTKA